MNPYKCGVHFQAKIISVTAAHKAVANRRIEEEQDEKKNPFTEIDTALLTSWHVNHFRNGKLAGEVKLRLKASRDGAANVKSSFITYTKSLNASQKIKLPSELELLVEINRMSRQ